MDYAAKDRAYPPGETERPMSRVDNDVQRLRDTAENLRGTLNRLMRHAKTLGYWSPVPETASNKLASVPTTLHDAIEDLQRAEKELSAALNVFD
jgi:uncharacterized protein YdeI (YjbR/CyaY-like superfamily)